jgi:hypothetical protein
MLEPNRSSRAFLQRMGLEATTRGPMPTIAPATRIIARIPLVPPLPKAPLLLIGQGEPPPDRGRSAVWPHGEAGEQSQ